MEAVSPLPLSARILPGEGEERVIRLLESIGDAFCAYDESWRFTYLNEAAIRLLAPHLREEGSLLGKCHWDAFPETRGTVLEAEYRRAVAEHTDVEFEFCNPLWKRWYKIRGRPIQGGGFSVFFTDVTDEKKAAETIRTGEERYRALLDSMDEGFCVIEMVWDAEGKPVDYRFLEVNPAFERHTGLKSVTGCRIKEINPSHEAHWFEIYGQVALSGEPVRFSEGSESLGRWFDVHAFPFGPAEKQYIAVRFTDVTERRQAELKMSRLSEENRARLDELETLLDMLPVGIAIAADAECKNIRLNAAFSQVLEVPQGLNASMTAPPAERPTNFRVLDDAGNEIPSEKLPMQIAAREGREIRDFELNIEHADGRRIRLLEYIAPLFDEHGRPRGSVGAFLDITERRQNEQRQQFLVALDDAVRPLGDAYDIVATSARLLGEHLKVNRCAYADLEADEDTMNITGDYTQDVASIVGRFTFTQFGSEVLAKMRANQPYIVEDIETHQPPPEDVATYRATEICAVICVPLHKAGRFVAAMAVHTKRPRLWTGQEVSLVQHVANRCWEALERARVTRELKESEARFRQIADLMPQVVWLARPDGFVDYYNRRWYDFTGQPEGETGDASWAPVMHPDDRQACFNRWYHSVRTGEPYEIRYRWHDRLSGGYRWFLGRALPLRDKQGEIVRWYGTSTDIDDVVRAEELARQARAEAERANRAKDDFLAALSHELRTPLTPVLMAAEDLCQDATLPEAAREMLQMMQRNISLEARLIDDLLDLTRIIHGKLILRRQPGDAHTLVEHALEIVRDEAQTRGLQLQSDLGASRSILLCDAARLQQVFWNLLKNAIKFTPARGSISIRSYNDGDVFVLEVSDTGIGLSSDTLDRIFMPFEQAGLTNDHRFGGLGLGLSISKAIVDMHEGEIVAESRGLEAGATFRVRLGLASAQNQNLAVPLQSGVPGASGSAETGGQRSLALLVVEDHEPTLKVLSRLLRRAGHDVSMAASMSAALEQADNKKFDLVVSDLGLPDGSGLELMSRLRSLYGLRGIALTGYGMEADQRQALEAGFVAHLIKPVEFAQLRRVLEQVTGL